MLCQQQEKSETWAPRELPQKHHSFARAYDGNNNKNDMLLHSVAGMLDFWHLLMLVCVSLAKSPASLFPSPLQKQLSAFRRVAITASVLICSTRTAYRTLRLRLRRYSKHQVIHILKYHLEAGDMGLKRKRSSEYTYSPSSVSTVSLSSDAPSSPSPFTWQIAPSRPDFDVQMELNFPIAKPHTFGEDSGRTRKRWRNRPIEHAVHGKQRTSSKFSRPFRLMTIRTHHTEVV